jgi:hypothetical protein
MADAKAVKGPPPILNVNVGVLGHVDSGKTSLGACELVFRRVVRPARPHPPIVRLPGSRSDRRAPPRAAAAARAEQRARSAR